MAGSKIDRNILKSGCATSRTCLPISSAQETVNHCASDLKLTSQQLAFGFPKIDDDLLSEPQKTIWLQIARRKKSGCPSGTCLATSSCFSRDSVTTVLWPRLISQQRSFSFRKLMMKISCPQETIWLKIAGHRNRIFPVNLGAFATELSFTTYRIFQFASQFPPAPQGTV